MKALLTFEEFKDLYYYQPGDLPDWPLHNALLFLDFALYHATEKKYTLQHCKEVEDGYWFYTITVDDLTGITKKELKHYVKWH